MVTAAGRRRPVHQETFRLSDGQVSSRKDLGLHRRDRQYRGHEIRPLRSGNRHGLEIRPPITHRNQWTRGHQLALPRGRYSNNTEYYTNEYPRVSRSRVQSEWSVPREEQLDLAATRRPDPSTHRGPCGFTGRGRHLGEGRYTFKMGVKQPAGTSSTRVKQTPTCPAVPQR